MFGKYGIGSIIPSNLLIKSAIATNAITNAIMINTSLPALMTESPKNEKNGCFPLRLSQPQHHLLGLNQTDLKLLLQ